MADYKLCTTCVMDTTDPEITFNEQGICSYCSQFKERHKNSWFPGPDGLTKLNSILNEIREAGRGKSYDCIMGLSGGLDSSYLAYLAKSWGLRPLCMHVDAGWNSEIAVKNIENLVRKLGYDLHTFVVNWEEMRDLQLSFFKAGVNNQDIPQDHAFFSALYRFATQNNIRFVLSGGNIATESVLPSAWVYNAMDLRFLKSVQKTHGTLKLKEFPTVNFFEYYFYYPFIKKMRVVRPLNYLPYNKEVALKVLSEKVGYRYYGGKHYESKFTKYFQSYYLPKKFGFDKRRAHLSSMILASLMTRDEALRELEKPLYNDVELREDEEYFYKKLGISREEYLQIMNQPTHSYKDYENNEKRFSAIQRLKAKISDLRSFH